MFSIRVIYERFSGSNPNSKDNSVGLQLLAIVLANSLPAYEASCGVDYDRLDTHTYACTTLVGSYDN